MIDFSSLSRHSIFGAATRAILSLLPSGTVVPIVQGPLRGKRWIVGSSNHGCWLGSYELQKQLAIAQRMRSGDVVCDIGANVGFYTLFFAEKVGPQGRVFAFEPVPRNLAYLRRHMQLNALENVSVFEMALSSADGHASFDPGPGPSVGRLAASGPLSVRTGKLDTLLSEGALMSPRILKIDVEGSEADVLLGGERVLIQHRPIVFLATHGKTQHQACCQILSSLGYTIDGLAGAPVFETDELIALPGGLLQGSM